MILGVGTDIVELKRLEQAIHRHGSLFLSQFLTSAELSGVPAVSARALEYYGGRWAAKEAIAKAIGCGFGKECGWHDLEILPNDQGAPVPMLSGTAAETAARRGIQSIHLSISHERDYATAVAIAEGKP